MARASFFLVPFLISVSVCAQEWHLIGQSGFSAAQAASTSLALNSNAMPYVAYTDWAFDLKCSVMMYNGYEWVYVGDPGFSGGSAYSTSIAIDNNNTPYVCYTDYSNGQKATVMKYNGTEWVPVGSQGISSGMVVAPSMAIDRNNNIYVAYEDFDALNDGPTVMKFNGSTWDTVGSPGFTGYEADNIKIAIDKADTPYIIFDSGGPFVMKYNGSNWEYVGGPLANDDVSEDAIAIDDSGTLYAAYSYPAGATYGEKYNATDSSWELLGNEFISSQGYYIAMVVDRNSTPYVIYSQHDDLNYAFVKKYDGKAWDFVGPTDTNGISSPGAFDNSIAIDKTNLVYVAFGEGTYGKATVLEYSMDTTGIASVSKTETGLNIFPNPAQNIATIEWQPNPTNENTNILIYDLLGNEVINVKTNNSGQAKVDISELANGMYIVKLLLDDKTTMDARLGVMR